MSEAWTVRRAVTWTAEYLEARGADAPRTDADLLLADALQVDRLRLLLDFDRPLSKEELAAYRARIERRAAGEPLAYILGRREFWKRDFAVDARVLVPRPETEGVVERALALVSAEPARVIDLCAGSGAIGITLAAERPAWRVDLVELDPGAAEVARGNALKHGVGDRVRVVAGDLWAAVAGEAPYDALVSNPPYVAAGEIEGLAREVRREPRMALDGGPDGLSVIRRLLEGAAAHLVRGAPLVLEIGIEQGPAARALAEGAGLSEVRVEQDFTRRDRYLTARR